MATSDVAEQPLGCGVDPADEPLGVEDVTRDAHVLQSLLEVTADCQARDHHQKCRRSTATRGGRSPRHLAHTVRACKSRRAGFPALRLLRCLIPNTRQAMSVDSVILNLGLGVDRQEPHTSSFLDR